jgi:predicted RNA-binding Zn-ribbon protein involved in translation (DUF1610 family)
MHEENRSKDGGSEFSSTEGLALALNYLADPADVPCPTCGPETIEVVAYLDAGGIAEGVVRSSSPEGEYTVVLYCHECRRAAALDLSPDSVPDEFNGEGESDRWAA